MQAGNRHRRETGPEKRPAAPASKPPTGRKALCQAANVPPHLLKKRRPADTDLFGPFGAGTFRRCTFTIPHCQRTLWRCTFTVPHCQRTFWRCTFTVPRGQRTLRRCIFAVPRCQSTFWRCIFTVPRCQSPFPFRKPPRPLHRPSRAFRHHATRHGIQTRRPGDLETRSSRVHGRKIPPPLGLSCSS